MTTLVDVVNFNCDASCLSPKEWLKAIDGGRNSKIYRWLDLYVKHQKKVILGFTGTTLIEIYETSPEIIQLIKENDEVFQVIPRPLSHDISFFRTDTGFLINNLLGEAVTNHFFPKVFPALLPPEFIITNYQLALLSEFTNIHTIFLNSNRLCGSFQDRYPDIPFNFKLHNGKLIQGIPFHGNLTTAYLKTIQLLDKSKWNESVGNDFNYLWRDGESFLFVPDGVEREEFWLSSENLKTRKFLETNSSNLEGGATFPYPPHTFSPWMKELKYFGYIFEMNKIEAEIEIDEVINFTIWLSLINSDVLSSVEKDSPIINLRHKKDDETTPFVIKRSDRWLEADEFLYRYKKSHSTFFSADDEEMSGAHWERFAKRLNFFKNNVKMIKAVDERIRSSRNLKR